MYGCYMLILIFFEIQLLSEDNFWYQRRFSHHGTKSVAKKELGHMFHKQC